MVPKWIYICLIWPHPMPIILNNFESILAWLESVPQDKILLYLYRVIQYKSFGLREGIKVKTCKRERSRV